MTLPAFSHADVVEIERFARSVQKKGAHSQIPATLTVGGMRIPTRAVAAKGAIGPMLGSEDLRALYSLTRKEMQLYCGGVEIVQGSRALDHIVCVVGHEALHAI